MPYQLHRGTIKINEIKAMTVTIKYKKILHQLIISHTKENILNTRGYCF